MRIWYYRVGIRFGLFWIRLKILCTMEALINTLGVASRTSVSVGIAYRHTFEQELGIAKMFLRLIPRGNRYFLVGGSLMNPSSGGPILTPGAPTVLINNLPAATISSMCTCVGPPDSIIKGSATVLLGGKPAARLGDSTAHGGSIVVGSPTVIIGG